MYSTSSGKGFLPLVSWDQAVTSVYIVLTAACPIQGKEEECMIHIRGLRLHWGPGEGIIYEGLQRFNGATGIGGSSERGKGYIEGRRQRYW